MPNIGPRFHKLNDKRDIGLLVFCKIERKKQAHRVLCGIKRRNGRFEIPLDTLLGKLDSVIEPIDKPALDSHVVLDSLAKLIVRGASRRVVLGMHRFVERLYRIICATKLFGEKRLRQSVDVVEKNVVDIALKRSTPIKKQVVFLFDI